MSKKAKEKQSKHLPKPKNRTTDDIVSGLIFKGDRNVYENPLGSKIIFLGKENLEKLSGYKSFIELWADGEVRLTITGLSPQGGRFLFDSIDKMKDDEIHGE